MYHAIVNDKKSLEIDWNGKDAHGKLDGVAFNVDVVSDEKNRYHFIFDNRSVNVELLEMNFELKTAQVRVNNAVYSVTLKDQFDDLLKSLGMEMSSVVKHKDVKAPMPGMVLSLLVEIGQSVEKDTPLVILEAMKMENVIKSPTSGVVKRVNAIQGNAVEKNTVLIEFE